MTSKIIPTFGWIDLTELLSYNKWREVSLFIMMVGIRI
jgi:hypothetical protein